MPVTQSCARWGCNKKTTYTKPLCYVHWQQWEAWELEECTRCHWIYGPANTIMYDAGGWDEEYDYLCDSCLWVNREEEDKRPPWLGRAPENRPPILAHAPLDRPVRHVYLMKLNDGSFYAGQTTNLPIRVGEHRDGLQSQTRGKDPKLVYFQTFKGDRREVNDRENEVTLLSKSPIGCRHIREIIESFREPLRLVDLEA